MLISQPARWPREALISAARRWIPFLIAGCISGALLAFVVSGFVPPEYAASAELYVAPAPSSSGSIQDVILGERVARSYAQLANAEVVLRPAMQRVQQTDFERFRERTRVENLRETLIIRVTFRDTNPEHAAAAANAIADSFIAQTQRVETSLQGTVRLWQPGMPPTEPETPNVLLNVLLGSATGLLVTLLAGMAISYIDDRIATGEDVQAALQLAPLGEVHRAEKPQTLAGKLFIRDAPGSIEAEAIRALRTNIAFANIDRPPTTILVTSAVAGEGKSVISANLALAIAESGTPTILMDADLRRPSQHSLFRVRANHGLTALLAGQLPFEALQQFRVAPNLLVIPAGTLPPNPAELLSSTRMTDLITRLREMAPHCTVILDASPVLAVADPIALATKVDGCLIVIDSGRTHASAPRHAVEALRRVHATVLGAVLNKVPRRGREYYYAYPPRPSHGLTDDSAAG